jgi:hypothetical protein
MKTFNRTSLPESITYNSRIYKCNATESSLFAQGINISNYILTLKNAGLKVILVKVLSRNLRGKTDYHNRLYKPTQWVFVSK